MKQKYKDILLLVILLFSTYKMLTAQIVITLEKDTLIKTIQTKPILYNQFSDYVQWLQQRDTVYIKPKQIKHRKN